MSNDRPALKVEISFVPTPLYPDVWTDVTDAVCFDQPPRIQRGRSDKRESMQAGTATLALVNDDRAFDPDYTGSPYYPYVKPTKRIRISGVWNGETIARFTGVVREWTPSWNPRDGRAIVIVDCVDEFGAAFAQNEIETQYLIQDYPCPAVTTDPLSGLPNPVITTYAPMTALHFSDSSPSGTYTITVDGATTPPLGVFDTWATVRAAVEALATVEAGTLYHDPESFSPTVDFGPYGLEDNRGFFFGGQYQGRDIRSLISVDTSGATGWTVTEAAPGAVGVTIPGVIGRVSGRTITVSTSAASVYNFIRIYVYGMIQGVQNIARSYYHLTNSTKSTSTTIPHGTIIWEQIYGIVIEQPIDSRDVGAPISISIAPATIPSGPSGAMLAVLATQVGWKNESLWVETGASTLQALATEGSTPVALFQRIAEAEGGICFIDRTGLLTFRSRTSDDASVATFGVSGGDLPYSDATPRQSERYIANDVRVTRTGGSLQRVVDNDSIEAYYPRVRTLTDLPLTTDAEALQRAAFLLAEDKEPRTRLERVVHRGELDPDALWPVLLQADLGEVYTINYPVAPDATPTTYVVAIEETDETITSTSWEIVWSVSPRSPIFILDESLLDGDDVLLY